MIKFTGDGVFMPMAMMRKSADDTKREFGSCRSVCGGILVRHGG